jgi:hypothetical protein
VGDLVAYTDESGEVTACFWVTKIWTIQHFVGPSTTAMLLFLGLGHPHPPPVESLVRGIPSRRRKFYEQFYVLSLHDGENAVPPRWQVIANSPLQPEQFEAIGQTIDGFTPMFAKMPRGARLRGSWVEGWMETWAGEAYSPFLDDRAIVREIEGVLELDATEFGPQDRRQDREYVSDLKSYLEWVSSRLRQGGRLNSSDVQKWEALRRNLSGHAWEILGAFDADFFDFARWEAASA